MKAGLSCILLLAGLAQALEFSLLEDNSNYTLLSEKVPEAQSCNMQYLTCSLWQPAHDNRFVLEYCYGGVIGPMDVTLYPLTARLSAFTPFQVDSLSIDALFKEAFRLRLHTTTDDPQDSIRYLGIRQEMLDSARLKSAESWHYYSNYPGLSRGTGNPKCITELYGDQIASPIFTTPRLNSQSIRLRNGFLEIGLPGVQGTVEMVWWRENGSRVAIQQVSMKGMSSVKIPAGAVALSVRQNGKVLWQGSIPKQK
jgi:hypothetical protein